MNLGLRIREARLAKGLKLDDVTRLTGIPGATISRYETGGVQKIPSTALLKLAPVLGLDLGMGGRPVAPGVAARIVEFLRALEERERQRGIEFQRALEQQRETWEAQQRWAQEQIEAIVRSIDEENYPSDDGTQPIQEPRS